MKAAAQDDGRQAPGEISFVDTTLRDGHQCLWASGMRTGMLEAVAEAIDAVGFAAVEVPVTGVFMKKFVRDLKEDPWEMCRLLARSMPKSIKGCMTPNVITPFELSTPQAMVELFYRRLVDTGALNRAQMISNTLDQTTRTLPWIMPLFRELGLQVALALSYTISPRHSDGYYAEKTRELASFAPDVIYLKDQGGLLTVDRLRTLLPAVVENSGGATVELHSHCTTGLAPLVYIEALALGVRILHTALPPLANGASQPSLFNVAANARLLGHQVPLRENSLAAVSRKLTQIAKQDGLPIGEVLEYDHGQYVHQVPGGVISNLRHQLAGIGMSERLDEVLQETVRVRSDMGYPIMITPHSQFIVTQAALNIAAGERYKVVIDELILFAQGLYGIDSGYTFMNENLKDRLLAMPRARELAAQPREAAPTVKELRHRLGGPGISDEEFLLRYIMKGRQEIDVMHAAGPYRSYATSGMPLHSLLRQLSARKMVGYVSLQRGRDALLLGSAARQR